MSEREHIWQDPADPSEKRDWDVPASVHAPSPAEDVQRGDRPDPDRKAGSHRSPARAPAEESEKRDWDVP